MIFPPGVNINHFWQGTGPVVTPINEDTHIPGLVDEGEGKVRGPVDALSVYYQRGAKTFLKPKMNLSNVVAYHRNAVLKDFQTFGVNWILGRWKHTGSALLADDMGLGKTLQTISAADAVGQGQVLVVCPGSVRLTWDAEIGKWAKNKRVEVLRTREQAASPMPRPRWTVTSYDLLPFLRSASYETVIIDEAHNFAGRKAKRGKRLLHFCAMAENRIALTGTPIWSRPRDYWMLFRALFGNTFGNAWDFDHAYCGASINAHGGLENSGSSRLNELKHRVSFYQLRRLKKDVAAEMPKLTRSIVWVDPHPVATAKMKYALLHRTKGAAQQALAATLDAKMEAAMELAISAKRFLLATWTKRHAQHMQRTLDANGTPCYLITGSISINKRRSLIALAAAKGHGIVATTDCLKEGVDGLQHVASVGILHALDFVPLKILQLEKRLDRFGQKEPVQWITTMMKESMDQWVNETVVSKLSQWGDLMGDDEGTDLRHHQAGTQRLQDVEKAEMAALRALYATARKGVKDEDA